jgi:hypothetical protein
MDGRNEALALMALILLACCGVRYILDNWDGWCQRARQAWERFSVRTIIPRQEGATTTTMMRMLVICVLEPVMFTGFFVLAMCFWIVLMLALGLGPILTALSIAFPGAALAYHLARTLTTKCLRYCERS